MKRSLWAGVVLSLVVTGLVSSHATAKRAGSQHAVVAVIDSGINPYHVTFRDDSAKAQRHPSTYIPGYPKDAIALRLSFGEKDYWTAVKKDCENVWAKVKPGQLYWFPGTKIVGGITFEEPSEINCAAPEPTGAGRILDFNGHGTMTASRATSSEYGACRSCSVVSVQFSANALARQDALDSITWAADNSDWIDAQSNSWGPFAPAWVPIEAEQLFTSSPEFVRRVEEVSQKHLAFWASGNGAAFRLGALGHPTLAAAHFTPSAIMVGGEDSGYMTQWTGFPPHVVSDACASWAAYSDDLSKSAENVGSGTSAATPFAAGGAAQMLMEARRILGDTETGVHDGVMASGPKGLVKDGPLADGEFTLEEWKRLAFVSATPRPAGQHEDGPPCGVVEGSGLYTASPIKWSDVPDGYPEYLHIGYGAVDDKALELAVLILRGLEPAPDRTSTDDYFELDRTVREALYEQVWSRP